MIEALHENRTYELSKHFLRERKRTCWNMIEHVHDSKGFPAKPLSHGFWWGNPINPILFDISGTDEVRHSRTTRKRSVEAEFRGLNTTCIALQHYTDSR